MRVLARAAIVTSWVISGLPACSGDVSDPPGASGGAAGATWAGGAVGAASAAGSGGEGPSCELLADQLGWAAGVCEHDGNDACSGNGIPTWDCDVCCEAATSGGTGGGGSGGTGGGGTGGASGSGGNPGFGYPVGDKSTSPAGGWSVWQVLGHYWSSYGGRHLAQDVSVPGGVGAIDAPVYSVADGTVLYAKPNSSAYKNVLLIEHPVGDGSTVCAFYGHINPPSVNAGDTVVRGQQVATVLDWAKAVSGGASSNTHLHYVLLSQALCDKAKNSGSGSGVCGYDKGGPTPLGRSDTQAEPEFYTAVSDDCGNHTVTDGFLSPTQFIDGHHF